MMLLTASDTDVYGALVPIYKPDPITAPAAVILPLALIADALMLPMYPVEEVRASIAAISALIYVALT